MWHYCAMQESGKKERKEEEGRKGLRCVGGVVLLAP
jgi:hypothetical protein